MYYYISGTLAMLNQSFAVIDAFGVGYRLYISASTYSALAGSVGKNIKLFSFLSVRDDAHELYGFLDEEEMDIFKALLTVSGIGPKGAMAILGTLSTSELLSAVASGDAKRISRAQGVGLKTAQKVCIELKGRATRAGIISSAPQAAANDELATVIDTLMVYGFKREQIENALRSVDTSLSTEEILGQTLRVLGSE